MPEAVFGGIRTYWRDWGTGPRRALLVHCSLSHSGAWAGVAGRLSGARHLQALDLPGHGQSGDHDPRRDVMDQTQTMLAGLVGDTPVDLIGHSFGAVACLRFALDRPALVRSLALYEPVFFAAARARGFDTRPHHVAPIAEADRDRSARDFTAIWGTGEAWDDLPASVRDGFSRRIHLIPAAMPAIYDDRARLLAPGRLEALSRPVLLLDGSASPPVVSAINAALADRLPRARRETMPGAGHMGPITHPGPVAEAIVRHLDP